MKFWVSKFLEDGVTEHEGELWESTKNSPTKYVALNDWHGLLKLNLEAWDNEAAAKADAEKRRARKVASLKKQIAKLEALTF